MPLLAVVAGLGVAGCGADAPLPPPSRSPETGAQAPAQRIVSLAPSLTAWVEELGAGERLVGVSEWCRPSAGDSAPVVVGRIDAPDLERLAALRPDLVLATTMTPPRQIERLRALGYRVQRHDHESIDGLLASLRDLGDVLDRDASADVHRRQLEHQLAPGGNPPGGGEGPPPRRAVVLLDLEPAYAAGPGSFPHELVARLGLPQITDQLATPWPQLGDEAIVQLNPEVVILSVGPGRGTPEEIRARWNRLRTTPAWRHTAAARDNRLVIIGDNGLTVPGPQLSATLSRLRAALAEEAPSE